MGSVKRDIIAIGGSAGSLQPLKKTLQDIAPATPAVFFVIIHQGSTAEYLPAALARSSELPVVSVESGMAYEPGVVYVAPPDQHMLVRGDHLVVSGGPRENGSRPAIDPLFRSAAVSHGQRVIGVVLSGYLHDGTHGLHAIKRCGGTTVVQDPLDAEAPAMPKSAIAGMAIDHVVPAASLARLLMDLVAAPIPAINIRIPQDLIDEASILADPAPGPSPTTLAGTKEWTETPLACPECGGPLWQRNGENRFRCHTGHAFSEDGFIAENKASVEHALWIAARALRDRSTLYRRLRDRYRGEEGGYLQEHYERKFAECVKEEQEVRTVIAQMTQHQPEESRAEREG